MIQVLKFRIRLLADLMIYVMRLRPDATLAMLVGTFSSFLEVAGLAALLPLTSIAAKIPISEKSPWNRIAEFLGQQPTARFFAVTFFALLLARTVTLMTTNIMTNLVMRKTNAHFSTRALEAFIHHLHFSQVQKESIGHFVSVAGEEAVRAAGIVSGVIRLVPLLALFLLYIGMITYQSWRVSAGFVIFCLVVSACLFGAFRKALELGALQQQQTRAAGTHFIESLNGLRTVRSFNAEKYVVSRYGQMMTVYMRTLFYNDAINSLAGAVPTLFLAAGMLLVTAVFISPAQMAILLPGIVVGIMMVLRLLPLATQTLDTAMRLASDLKAAENISEMLEAVKTAHIADANRLPPYKEPIRSIEFDKVTFRYSRDTPHVLQEFSTRFVAGKSYAISGPSGAGKSTIVDLLLKFYAPDGGIIRVNDRDIQSPSPEDLRPNRRCVFSTIPSSTTCSLDAMHQARMWRMR
jgi:ABC-type multidrug transport system fused ATPase/permease subunit